MGSCTGGCSSPLSLTLSFLFCLSPPPAPPAPLSFPERRLLIPSRGSQSILVRLESRSEDIVSLFCPGSEDGVLDQNVFLFTLIREILQYSVYFGTVSHAVPVLCATVTDKHSLLLNDPLTVCEPQRLPVRFCFLRRSALLT